MLRSRWVRSLSPVLTVGFSLSACATPVQKVRVSAGTNVTETSIARTVNPVPVTAMTAAQPTEQEDLSEGERLEAGMKCDPSLAGTIIGTEGDDVLVGTPGRDFICGLGGNDRIDGGAGNDIIIAGSGDDLIDAGEGNDFVFGDQGDDTITGGTGEDSAYGFAGNDIIRGSADDDQMFGDDGDDELRGDDGVDHLDGGAGSDSMFGGDGDDWILGGTNPVERVRPEIDVAQGEAGWDVCDLVDQGSCEKGDVVPEGSTTLHAAEDQRVTLVVPNGQTDPSKITIKILKSLDEPAGDTPSVDITTTADDAFALQGVMLTVPYEVFANPNNLTLTYYHDDAVDPGYRDCPNQTINQSAHTISGELPEISGPGETPDDSSPTG
jgi:RTX calcium-binding nonapeptide repeat (4 copies)